MLIGILVYCNSSDKTKTTTQGSAAIETVTDDLSNAINKDLKTIDTNEDLIATALMAAPRRKQSRC